MRASMHHAALSSAILIPLLAASATAEIITTAEGLKIDETHAVHCDRPSRVGDTISVHYRGTLENGKEFDSSYKRGDPFTFHLGAHPAQVIQGWDLGFRNVCVGSKRKLIIPPSLGYGARNMGDIPPNSVLIFETELMHIKGVPDPPPEGEKPTPTTEEKPEEKPADPSKTTSGDTAANTSDKAPAEQGNKDGPAAAAKQETNGECRLLGPFALFVQGALGVLALLSLVFKRWRERPRRPLQIWFFDASKQVVGTALLHIANLAMSMLSSPVDAAAQAHKIVQASKGEDEKLPNPCSFYLLNLAIDTTIGIPILVVLLRILHALFLRTPLANPPESLKSGHYGTPPHVTWWIKQSFIYFIGLFGMKLFVLFMFQALPWLPWVGDWALRWTEGNESVQIAFVMFIFPLAMNAIQYYIIDTFIKEKNEGYQSVQQEEDRTEEDEREHGQSREIREVGDDDENKPSSVIRTRSEHGESSGSDNGSVSKNRAGREES
ncbi:hypothetical protein K461DRAFT_329026 [Myriangium duriaei CBS 260.36]|uniref:peptidylprolyl isomerase n=1 Tax=Myriangium duriaei CBS 260.36 TaxID=1168546 RepID=A0A9P4IXN8_9PEZI|nr:hypothetical protein K461DRAFT_329026 [Myriangium duriaei CBS 260.36]